jgi:hypothetical protein
MSGPVHPAAEESSNVKYLCLVYEEAKADAVSAHESATLTDEDLEYLADLQVSGHSLASARLQPAETAATVRVRNGTVFISDALSVGEERLGGFHLIDARDLNDAIRITAKMPWARLGWIEVRPLEECGRG